MKVFGLMIRCVVLMIGLNAVSSDARSSSEDETKGFDNHDVSQWNNENKNAELSEAIVNGLAATKIKRHLNVGPKTQCLKFRFYNYVTEFLKKYVHGLNTVRLANVIIHFKPHSDHCRGSITYALIDTRSTDSMTIGKTISVNGQTQAEKDLLGNNKKRTVDGKIHQRVTVKCNEESIIQFSMNYFVTVDDLKKIVLVQITNGISLIKGTMATLSIGWMTVPGEATVYQSFKAQRYYIPRLQMPELSGKNPTDLYKSFVKMAKDRQNAETKMLNDLEEIINGVDVINNDLIVETQNEIELKKKIVEDMQDEIEMIDKVMPEKTKKKELDDVIKKLEKIKKEKVEKMKLMDRSEIVNEIEDEMNDDEINKHEAGSVIVGKDLDNTSDHFTVNI